MRDRTPGSAIAIVVHYTAPDRTRRCVESLRAQVHLQLEVVVVDHSAGGSGEPLGDLCSRYVRPPLNTGFGGGVRAGLQGTRAEVALLLNPDAVAAPSWARSVQTLMDAQPQCGMVATRVLSGTHAGRLDSAGLSITRGGMGILRGFGLSADVSQTELDALPLLGPSGAAAAYRTSLLDSLGGFPDAYFLYYEDLEVAWRARCAGFSCGWIDAPLVTHDHDSSAGASKRFYLQRGRELFRRRNPHAARSTVDRSLEAGAAWIRAIVQGEPGLPERARRAAREAQPEILGAASPATLPDAVPTLPYLLRTWRGRR